MIPFSTQLISFLTAGMLLAASCNSTDTPPTDRVSLKMNQSARLGSEVVVRVDSIEDNRCPMNANCIWAGQAKVKLQIAKDQDSKNLQLMLGQDIQNKENKRPDSTGVTLANEIYKVILREVTPYPETTSSKPQQTAVIQVTKL
ncbi:hypothetical protein [Spirosoma daeguense]